MLRKHLQHLEKPLEVEGALNEQSPNPDKEEADHDREGMEILFLDFSFLLSVTQGTVH